MDSGLLVSIDQSTSPGTIEPRYGVHGKGSSMGVGGLVTPTTDGLSFPSNFLSALRGLASDRDSRTSALPVAVHVRIQVLTPLGGF
jgi:hypothetical protein